MLNVRTFEFNVVDSLVQGLGRAYQCTSQNFSHVPLKVLPWYVGRTFNGAWEQFWPDALPAATNNSITSGN